MISSATVRIGVDECSLEYVRCVRSFSGAHYQGVLRLKVCQERQLGP
jgi:hypothetical protein